ncbi:MAG: aminotransferase class V-fold PLP-dependent enzyme [Cyanobacteria bacterium REEB67]|nr:aminotransferase class V-fold PLP-dependent enzyme [Cyanobacteria bacterium REEB67]
MYCSPFKVGNKIENTESGSKLDPALVRAQFPIFNNNPDLIYFDNASTSQKPASVIEVIDRYHTKQCANAGRGAYSWSTQLDKAISESREKVAAFIGARAEDTAFTSGATDSLNTVALAWGLTNLEDGDEIMLCPRDHKSAVLPWYNLKDLLARQGKTITIQTFDIHEVGDYDLKSIKAKLSPRTRLLAMAHIHHVFGLDMEVPEIRQIVGDRVLISLDASQSIGHIPVDVSKLDVDFLSFSGHKVFATTGSGVLWVNPRVKEKLHAVKLGGKSEASIKERGELIFEHKSTAELLEAGTQNIPAILSLGQAVQFVESVGLATIQSHISNLTVYLYSKLRELPGIIFAPGMGICRCEAGFGIISFRFEQISNLDLSFVLDAENIFVRSGDHCTYARDQSEEYLRVSMHLYNSAEEVDQFIAVLEEAAGL